MTCKCLPGQTCWYRGAPIVGRGRAVPARCTIERGFDRQCFRNQERSSSAPCRPRCDSPWRVARGLRGNTMTTTRLCLWSRTATCAPCCPFSSWAKDRSCWWPTNNHWDTQRTNRKRWFRVCVGKRERNEKRDYWWCYSVSPGFFVFKCLGCYVCFVLIFKEIRYM